MKYTDEEIAQALKDALGIITKAALKLGADRGSIAERVRRSEYLRNAWKEAKETALDLCEDRLLAGINNGEPWAIKYMLSTQGGERGYKERREVEMRPAGPDLSAVPTSEIERIVAERGRKKNGGKD